MEFSNKLDLQDHNESIMNEIKFSCDICSFEAESYTTLNFHIDSLHSENDFYDVFIEPQIIALLEKNGYNPFIFPSEEDSDIECDDSVINSKSIQISQEFNLNLDLSNSIYKEIKDFLIFQNETKFNDIMTSIFFGNRATLT